MDQIHIIVLAFLGLIGLLCLVDGFNGRDEGKDNDRNDIKEHVAPVSWKGSGYGNYWHYWHYPWLARNHMLPWWNSTRHTRNSSWDLRGDVVPRLTDTGPFYRSPHVGYHHVDY